MKKLYAILIIAGVTLSGGLFLIRSDKVEARYDTFAQCLAEKNVIMYGASWCPHCQNEKRQFGSSFQYVPYVECPEDPKKCLALGIQGYPTWIFGDGQRVEGEMGLERLSQVSGCVLPASL